MFPVPATEVLLFAPRPILIVDDDIILRNSLAGHFSLHTEFDADQAGSVAEAQARLAAASVPHAAVLLEVGLPDGDGSDLCARLRGRGLKIPIVMLAAAGAEQDVVRGLEAGANDYITKPYRTGELLARVRAHLRVFDSSEHATFAVGPYLFRPASKRLIDAEAGRRVQLGDLGERAAAMSMPRKGQGSAAAGACYRGVGLWRRVLDAEAECLRL